MFASKSNVIEKRITYSRVDKRLSFELMVSKSILAFYILYNIFVTFCDIYKTLFYILVFLMWPSFHYDIMTWSIYNRSVYFWQACFVVNFAHMTYSINQFYCKAYLAFYIKNSRNWPFISSFYQIYSTFLRYQLH